MDKSDVGAICRLLAKVESSEGERFKQAVKDGSLEYVELFGERDGVLAIFKDENEYSAVCAFKNVMRDYDTARKIERTVTRYLKAMGPEGMFSLCHGGEQVFLNNFVCKLNFGKPHYGVEYKLRSADFCDSGELAGLEVRPYAYDKADELFNIHARAFLEQNTRAERPGGYDEEDTAYIRARFGTPNEENTFNTFYLDGVLIGYTLFQGGYADLMALDPAYQGNGYGRAMLAYSTRQAIAAGIKSVRLHTFFINAKAQRLYESLGFKRAGFYCINDAKPYDKLCFDIIEPPLT